MFALELSNRDETTCNSGTNSGSHRISKAFVLKAFRELDGVVPHHVWVSQWLLNNKSSPIICKQGNEHVELW